MNNFKSTIKASIRLINYCFLLIKYNYKNIMILPYYILWQIVNFLEKISLDLSFLIKEKLMHRKYVVIVDNTYFVINTLEEINQLLNKDSFDHIINKLLLEFKDCKTVFLDIGANIGKYSILASKLGYKVYAFEPIKELCCCINKSSKKKKKQSRHKCI